MKANYKKDRDVITRLITDKQNSFDFIATGRKRKSSLKKRSSFRSMRGIVVLFVVMFVFSSAGVSYLLSGGRPIFGEVISDVSKNDQFYSYFQRDENEASATGPSGGPDLATLKLFNYRIAKNESLSVIARKTGVSLDSLISVNKLTDAHMIRVGARLTVPNQKGIYYMVKRGDSLVKIARKYKTSSEDIKFVNGIIKDTLKAGRLLFIPGARLSRRTMEKALGLIFRKPAYGGYISSSFGYRRDPFTFKHRFHSGIDIALNYWTKIRAVRSGKVIFSGWKGGYGKLVVLKHSRGFSTRYGHMIKYVVRAGQRVRAGQLLGYVGSTGYSTGPHLHFEIRKYGKLLNPMRVKGFRRAFRR